MCKTDSAQLHVAESLVGSPGQERFVDLAQRKYEGAGEFCKRHTLGY